jgi:hypothetical protein
MAPVRPIGRCPVCDVPHEPLVVSSVVGPMRTCLQNAQRTGTRALVRAMEQYIAANRWTLNDNRSETARPDPIATMTSGLCADGLEAIAASVMSARTVAPTGHALLTIESADGLGTVDYLRVCTCGWSRSHFTRAAADAAICTVLAGERERHVRALRDGERIVAALRDVRFLARPVSEPSVPTGEGVVRHG